MTGRSDFAPEMSTSSFKMLAAAASRILMTPSISEPRSILNNRSIINRRLTQPQQRPSVLRDKGNDERRVATTATAAGANRHHVDLQ